MQQRWRRIRRRRRGEESGGRGPVPVGILLEPDGKLAFVANTNADLVTVIDLTTWKIAGRLTAGKEPDGLGYSRLVLAEQSSE